MSPFPYVALPLSPSAQLLTHEWMLVAPPVTFVPVEPGAAVSAANTPCSSTIVTSDVVSASSPVHHGSTSTAGQSGAVPSQPSPSNVRPGQPSPLNAGVSPAVPPQAPPSRRKAPGATRAPQLAPLITKPVAVLPATARQSPINRPREPKTARASDAKDARFPDGVGTPLSPTAIVAAMAEAPCPRPRRGSVDSALRVDRAHGVHPARGGLHQRDDGVLGLGERPGVPFR